MAQAQADPQSQGAATNLQVVVRADIHRPCLVRPGLGLQLSLHAVCPMLHCSGTLLLQLVHLGSGDVVGEEDHGLHRVCKLPARWHEVCGARLLCLEQPARLMAVAERLQEGASRADREGPADEST